uniref:Dystonin n=1 Tax=Oncorhynchus kisutch TaxID=8019 RepID=A0A8C7KHR9_ONCKI
MCMSSGSGNASLHCSMSSSADFSDEDDYSFKSGSVSPAPGDTLPWNLPRHERHKRKIQGGSVLDPAERAVLRIADERDRVQKKTFTKWINQHLLKVRKHVNDLYEDLRDGHNLISLLEVLSGQERDFLKTLRLVSLAEACAVEQHGDEQVDDKGPREKGRMRFHRLQNVQIALDYLKRRQVKLVNIRNDDITDGNPKLTLGLIWTIILHFQISEIHVCGESDDMTAKERLLMWSQQMTEGYVGVRCNNFTTSWRDGRLFNAIIHKYRPDLVDMGRVTAQTSRSNLEQAFGVAERLGVARLLDPEDVDVQSPDEKSVITYVSTMYDVFPKVPDGVDGINANDVDIKWVEYQNMVNYLIQWIKHNVGLMSDRAFPNNPVELKALYTQYLQFKENEIPLKETEKSKIKHLYKMLEVWMEFGRIQLPRGFHPNDVEKEWGKLIVAMLEREKSKLCVYFFTSLLLLNFVIEKYITNCLDIFFFSQDAKRLESGVQFQNEAEVSGYLLECENHLRQQVVDIQILLDGKFYCSDRLVQRCKLTAFSKCHATHVNKHNICWGMDPGSLQHHKYMQIRKPLGKSSLVDPNMTKEEVNMNFVQDLINWVEEMQVQLDHGDWGADLPSVETHLENHRSVHRAIEEFQMSLKEAKLSEMQMTQAQKLSYSEKLGNLEYQYGKLLKCSRERQKSLESLHDFVSRATMELIWLNEKEEEEVAFDWSDRNGNISKKRQYHAVSPDTVQNVAYRAAMQTQWSWILQLCSCVEQHLKDNTVYFEFFNDAKESMDYLKSLQGDIQRKYGCDRTSSVHKLEDHIQESMDEKEQLLQYRSTVAGLVGKAKAIVQLKPRTPDTPIRSSIPVKAICDYRQIEITIYKDDECVLASNSHRAKWKVISPSGNEAMVPSVCFTVPPPNKEAVDQASRIEQLYQNVLTLWHHSHINMKSVVSWHYLMADVKAIRNWNTMLPGEHQQVLSNLQSHFEDFLEDSEESEVFTMADCSQLEREVLTCKEYYEELLKSAEREEHEESVYNLYISEVRNFRMRLEAQEEHLIRQIRTPLDRDDLEQSILRITEQEKKAELDQLMEDLETMKEKCETFLRQATASPSVPALSSDLNVLIQSMSQVYSMSSIYLEKLKTVSLVVRHSQNAEALVKLFEAKLSEEDAVNSDLKSIDTVVSTLKVSSLGSKIDEQREVFHDLEDGLQKARGISDHMFKAHNERDFDLDWHKEKADQLGERWHDVHTQIDSRLVFSGQLKCLGTDLIPYTKMEAAQLKTQENQPEDSKALAELLNQQKVLVAEMEHKQSRIDECQKYSEQYSSGAKDYELQLMTYRAMVDSQHKSPLKRRRMQNSADAIVQEFMDLRTRYTAVVTSMTQYVKFASETLKRTEGEEVGDCVYELADLILSRMVVVPDANSPLAGLWDVTQKRRVTILQGHQQSLIDRLTALRLLEAQACTGGICDPASGEKATVTEALRRGLLDETFARQLQQCEQTIEGVLEVGSVEVYSVFSSVQSGLIDHYTGLCLLEAQLITSGLVLPQLRMCLELDDAFHHNLIDEPTWKQLRELNEANQCILSPLFSSEPLPVIAAVREGAISERLAMKFIEIQLATGGLRVSYTSDVLTLERAFQFGLIPDHLYVKLLERQDTWKDLINPSTAEKVSLTQLVQRSVADVETGLRLLPVKKSHNGNMELTSGREISVLSAVHEGLIDRQTTMRLLGAQLFAGGIVNPKTGRKLTVEEALSEGLIDQGTATGILSQQAQNGGIVNPQNGKTLSVDEAVQCDLMSSSSALLVLEKQKGFMGLLWPHSGEILTVSTSLQHEIITNQLAFKLLSNRQKIAALYIAEDSEVVDINSATQNGLIDTHTAEVLKTIEIPDVFPDVDDLNDRFSSWLMLRELQIGGSHCPTDDIENDGENINAPSPIEAKQLFISYLMLNSYMDPKSGQRLLIFDGQLTKMAELLVNISVETSENQLQNTALGKAGFVDISLKEDISEVSEISFESNTEDFGYLHINEETDDTRFPSAAQNSKCLTAEKEYSSSENNVEHSIREIVHSFTDESSISIDSKKNTRQHTSEICVLPDRIDQENTMRTSPTSIQMDSETDVASDNQTKGTFNGGSATQPILKSSTLCSVKDTGLNLPPGAQDSPQRPTNTPGCETDKNTKSESSLLSTLLADTLDTSTEFPCTEEEAWDNEDEREVLGDERSTVATLKEAVSRGSISSQIALQIMEQQSLLGGVYDSKSGCTIRVNEALDSGMIDDDLAEKILHSDPVHNAIIDPDRNCMHSISYSQSLGLIDNNEAENICQHQTDKKVAVLVLDAPDEDVNGEEGKENRNRHAGEDVDAEGNREQNCDSQNFLTRDLDIAKQLLKSANELIPTHIHQDLASAFRELQPAFADVCQMSAERNYVLMQAIDKGKVSVFVLIGSAPFHDPCLWTQRHLEDTAFDTQYFISEHAQFLSPAQSRHLLKSLSATQRAIKDQMERVANQRRTLQLQLEISENESQQKVWTQMTGLRAIAPWKESISALQKDILTNGSALNEVISSTKKFLDENRSMLTPDQIAAIESKLEDAKSKVKLINQRAEESRKDMEKSVTTAIKQETEKAHHQEILSQQQDMIMATQSAQALLDHQAHALSSTEKDKLQMDIQELKGRYDASLTQAEQQMKQVVQVQEELKKFQGDCEEFEGWLQQAEGEVGELGAPAGALNILTEKLQRQKSFSEDVISHKGDLRFITISGQKVLDVAKACGRMDPKGKDAQLEVDTTGTCATVKDKLDSVAGRYKALHSQVNFIYQYHKTDLAHDIVERYDNLSKSVSDRNEKLQITLTRSLSVQDGLDEMMSWMEGVEESVKEKGQVPLDSAAIGDVLSNGALEQDISSRQSSISAMKAKVKKFVETADPSAAAVLQSKMDTLSQRFSDTCDKHKQKMEQLEQLKDKVEEFEKTSDKVQQFVLKRSQALSEIDGPGKNVNELSQLMQDVEILQKLSKELSNMGPEGSMAQIQGKIDNLSNNFNAFKDTVKEKYVKMTVELSYLLILMYNLLVGILMMVVQQNMSYINEGHERLGELLKDRAAELSGLVQQMAEAQKETDAMITWLKDMKKTTASWNSASTEKDAMKTQLEQQKVDSANAWGCAKFKLPGCFVLTDVCSSDAAWADVSGSVEDRKQHLEESNRNLDVFQTTEPQLRQWLSEKEMMLSVLGPLSMDPNMLNTQRQQVQILLNEFDSRKPQYDQLNEAAAAILSTSAKQDPSSGGKVVKDQLAAVTQKWQGLTGQLRQRAGLIDQAVGKTGQFQDLLRSLSQSAASLETRLNSQQAVSSQPDVVKNQLEEANIISGQLREERKRLKEAETLCSELSALVTEDYLKTDLARQLEVVTKPFKQLEDKAVKRIQQLNSAFASSQQFHQTSKDFQEWMNETLQEQSKSQAVSAQVENLQQSLKEHSALQKALSEHKEPYSTIVREGETLLQNTDGAEKVALQGQLATLRSNWDDVKKSSSERQDKLQGALQRAQKYHEHAEKLQSWVQESEVREGSVRLSVDPAEVESSISQLKAIQKDVDKHRGLVAQLNTAAESLLEVANADIEAVREEKAAIGQSVDRVTERVQNKRDSLDKISQRLKEFNDTHKEAKGQLAGAKKQLDAHTSLGVQAYSNKNLISMKAQQKSLDGVNTQLEHLKSLAQGLVADVPEADGVTDLLLQADSLEKEYGSLSKDVGKTCSTLEGKLQGIGQFQTNIREMFTCFADLDDELDSMAPVGRELATLNEQQGGIKVFVEKLQELMADTARGEDRCKKMLETEASPDLLGLKRDLDVLSKQCGKLMDRAKGREEEVGSTLTRLNELYSKLQQFTNKLGRAEVKEEGQGSVGMETDVINQQLEAFKVFQKEEVDPLQTQLQDINWLGQGLIQNAAKGTSTKGLEHDLEDGNTRWNTLNKKIAERSAQLHEALLHCGRFQDALESLLSWLTDTEELVSNQKPPSAEFKVVKAQIQEQILLQRLLDDRRPTVELIKKEGGKVVDLGAEFVEKEKVGKEIECLGQRWDALLKKAENRHKQLKSILVVAQQFHETLEPLSEWLSATEKRLAKSEPIGTQTTKLEVQISQHKALEEEIMGHSKDLVQSISLGQMLKPVSSVDDKELVQSKLDSTQASYIELQERCRRKAEMLQQALANAQLFGEDEVALMNWLNEVHTTLSEVSVKDYKTDVLEKQCAEQLALHEDIELRKQNVDQAISNGLELLKQTTGDEVVVIQGKLDGIKTRYAEINSMSGNVSKTLDQALTLASKLQHIHEDLSSWLETVEAELTAFAAQEPVGEQLIQAQDRQKALLKEAMDHKPQVDKLNEVSSSLLELVPWRAREGLDKLVTEDNDRYKAASDTITQHVEQINAAILKSQQFEQAADNLLAWLTEAERKMLSLGEVRLEQDQTTAQLQAQKGFSMDIMRHKDAVDDIHTSTSSSFMFCFLQVKIQALLEKYGVVSQLNSERCLQLERAQSLASQFWETYEELWPWLQETRTSFSQLPLLAIEYEALRQQQEELRQMRELIAEHKPHIDKMNKTGPQLLELSPVEGIPIREKYTATDLLYAQLKADVKQRAATLDEAISKSTQFHDKIEPMLESLERIAERLRQPPSISVEVEKIREQITENKAVSVDLEKLQPSYDTLKQRGEEMIARSAGADKDISAKAVQDKLDQMVFTWNEIHALMEEREAKLLDVMDLADKFWCDHCALIVTIKDTQDLLRELEEPGVDPSVVKQQQESLESFKEEIDGLQEELDVVRNLGAELMAACGEPDKPVIKKSIDEVNSAWETLNKSWKERVDRLDEAMQAAVQFQDGLQGMFDWVDIVEHKLDSMSPVGTDLDTVKQQIEELKEFKGEAYQLQIEMERLNHQAGLLLKKVTEEYDRCAIQEPMTELKMLWDNLDENIINRQHKLEGALLALGQFQHALDELLAWMSNTEELLNEQRKAAGDPKAIEIELAKHHVLQNDVLAHKTTVEVVNKAGTDLVESTSGEEASGLQSKLENLTQRWKNILEKTEQRRHQLDGALLQAQGFHGEMEDMQQWLKDTERQLLASKAVGGLPDTAREQLNAHLELCSTLEAKEELYQQLMNKGQQLLTMTPSNQDSNTEQDLRNLQDKRESVQVKVAERKVKLEEALTLATEFHNSLQDFINWLTQAEQTLTMSSPASLILENIMFQIDEHKVFVTEVNSHREQIVELDKTGTHLKYFSQKQDVVLIKNLLISVQGRWEKVVQRSVERGRLLDDARKRAKQFHETWNKLTEWLDESEKALDSELEIANDPDKIKMQLAQHKEFQKALGSKHSVYDTTSRTGRALKDKTSLQDDNQKLDDMLSELRDKWDTVCGKSVERQNKLEEALLFSGQFTDALQALIDWLYRVEPQLAEDQPVHGDIDLVLNLIDSHKVFQKELGKRTGSVAALKRSAKDLIESSHEDSSWVKAQMQELSARWETVCARSVSKQTRLEQALCQAEEFHSTVHILLEWLAEAEQSLRFHGTLPDDEDALRALIEQHKEFMKKQEEKGVGLNKATSMGEAILTICHPDSITTIKHWNTIIKARFEEVQAWARQHQQRLAMALSDLLATQELLEGLLGWLQWAEATLNEKDKEVLPQEIDEVKALIAEHQTFMEEMTRKQPDVDTITKTHKRKAAGGSEPAIQSQIPVLEKGRGGRKRSPTQAMYPSASQPPIVTKNPRVNLLVSKWQQVWLLALDRRRKLNDAMDRLEELKEFANFDFDVWRKRYMRWMNHKKSRVMDFFRRIDKDQDGKVTRQEFIEGILSSKFPTSRLEMSAVADIFDRDGDGYIDYYEFVAALHPNKEAYKPLTDADKIEDEVLLYMCGFIWPPKFSEQKHSFIFGDSQQLRLVRILRSTVMVRVGGGWMALDEFLVKNDPCRVHHHGSKMLRSESNSSITQSPIAKGRTNMELREKFILPEGTTQVMASFRYRGRRSRPSSRAASPNRSNSSHSCPAQHNNPALPSTPKTPQHITRNYDKPWLTNSKPSTPLKSSDSFESQDNNHTGIFCPPESRRSGSRPGSKAGSRGSSRRGSDASDFDISDIASVCSDTSETVGDTSRATPRSSSRQHGGKPSRIPTPQRRSTPSKLAQTSKR